MPKKTRMKMKFKRNLVRVVFLGCLCFLTSFSFTASGDTLTGASLHPYGRYLKDQKGIVELIGSAVHVGFKFTGTVCSLYAYISDSAGHNYLQYTLDGVYQRRIKVTGNAIQQLNITGLDSGSHTVWVYKATEAATGPVFIEKIVARHIIPLQEPDRVLIEFIGNSITCGALADSSELPCGVGEYHDHHNAYYAYGPRLARKLNANFILSCVSGIGIYRNWNTLGPTMPQVYEKTDFQINSSRGWNFKTYSPRIVSIALGTNDFSEGDHKHERLPFDSAVYVSGYIRFVQLVKSKYPRARIILLSSPMLNGSKREQLQNCLEAVKNQVNKLNPSAKSVVLFFFKPMQPRGCSSHPSVEDHAVLAGELLPAFKKLLLF